MRGGKTFSVNTMRQVDENSKVTEIWVNLRELCDVLNEAERHPDKDSCVIALAAWARQSLSDAVTE